IRSTISPDLEEVICALDQVALDDLERLKSQDRKQPRWTDIAWQYHRSDRFDLTDERKCRLVQEPRDIVSRRDLFFCAHDDVGGLEVLIASDHRLRNQADDRETTSAFQVVHRHAFL